MDKEKSMVDNPGMETIIRKKLQKELSPFILEIVNDSAKHHGHTGASPNSHFRLKIASSAFDHLSRVQSHQLIYDILSEEMETGIHALSIWIVK